MEEHRYKHRYSLMCAETMSEKRHMKLSPDSGEGTAGWVGGGRETNVSLGYCFILLETFTMTMYYFFN